VSSHQEGTGYVISIAIPTKPHEIADEPYAVTRNTDGHLYQYVKIDGDQLSFTTLNADNKVIDSFNIIK